MRERKVKQEYRQHRVEYLVCDRQIPDHWKISYESAQFTSEATAQEYADRITNKELDTDVLVFHSPKVIPN